jgi:hypothetical protein
MSEGRFHVISEVGGGEAGAVDGEVGDVRRIDEPEGHLDSMALAHLTLGGGRVPELRDARRSIRQPSRWKGGRRGWRVPWENLVIF